MRIGDKDVKTGDTSPMCPPHDHQHKLGFIIKQIKRTLKQQLIAL